jgi:hypothetical protein
MSATTNALVATELSKFIDWPETGLEEINVDLRSADFRPARLRVHPGHYFRVARHPFRKGPSLICHLDNPSEKVS